MTDHDRFAWYCGAGPDQVIIGRQIRLFRNLADLPFPPNAAPQRLQAAQRIIADAINEAAPLPDGVWEETGVKDLSRNDTTLLEECDYLPKNASRPELVMLTSDGNTDCRCYFLLNTTHHLEIVRPVSGTEDLPDAYGELDRLEHALEDHLKFAFHPRFGYLAADPADAGTGLKVSFLLHLPALTLTEETKQILNAADPLGVEVRGFFGEKNKFPGNLFEISNRSKMGETERTILNRMTSCINTIAEQERNARKRLMEQQTLRVLDFVSRSRAVLQNAYRISTVEAMNALSGMKLAWDLELPYGDELAGMDWADLLLAVMPGHVAEGCGGSDGRLAEKRAAVRAGFLRETLTR